MENNYYQIIFIFKKVKYKNNKKKIILILNI